MKKILLILLVFSLVFGVSCSDDSTDYFISFTVDGVQKNFNYGFEEDAYGSTAFACFDTSGSNTAIFGQPVLSLLADGQPDDYIFISIDHSSSMTGFYNEANADIEYRVSADSRDSDSVSIGIVTYGAVDGVVEGVFSGIVISSDGTITNTITNGAFRVLRVEDDLFGP